MRDRLTVVSPVSEIGGLGSNPSPAAKVSKFKSIMAKKIIISPEEFADKIDNKYFKAIKNRDIPIGSEKTLIANISLKDFLNLFKNSTYSENDSNKEIQSQLLYFLSDIIFEIYLLSIDIALYNKLLYTDRYEKNEIQNSPHLLLIHLSIDQSVILKNAILLGKVMDFVYYLEFGEKLEDVLKVEKYRTQKKGPKPSKSSIFFKSIKSTNWKFLIDYKHLFIKFNEKLRTPEVHLSSRLADQFNKSEISELTSFSELNIIHSFILNMFWQPLLKILRGEKVNQAFWDKGMETLANIKLKDLGKMIKRP